MSNAFYDELFRFVGTKTDDAVHKARQRRVLRALVDTEPEMKEELRTEGRLEEERGTLRRVIALRRLACSAEDEARIDACADLSTLRRWLDQAVVAASTAEALR